MKKTVFTRSMILVILTLFVLAVSGCNMELNNRNNQYVADVKKLVNELTERGLLA